MFSVARFLDRNQQRRGDQVAVIDPHVRLTHGELNQRVQALAAGLQSLGLGRDDVVAILLGNGHQFLETTLAVNLAGAIFLPLNTRLAGPELVYIIAHADARAIVVGADLEVDLATLRQQCPALAVIVGVGEVVGATADYDELVGHDPGRLVAFDRGERDISRLMYTSGTTARPKGVPLSYGNVHWKIFDHIVEFGLTPDDRTLMAGPMYHVGSYDLPGTGTLYAGGSLVIAARFDALDVLETVGREGVTNVWLAPSMVNAILQVPRATDHDTDSVRFVTNGGEKMPVSLIERFLEVFPRAWLADSFGMTETVSGDMFLDPRSTLTKLGSVGRPVLHVEARVVDPEGLDVGDDEPGELLLRGPKVFAGYWRDEAATEAAFVDGWFRTGDIAHHDGDGYFYIDDRKKDMIVSGGENIASPEVERVIYGHPDVLEVAVVGIPHERWGEVPKAIVVRRPGSTASAEDIIDHCRGQLARFKVPKVVEFREVLPRTASGKIMKRELR